MSTPRTKSLGRAVDLLRACASRPDGASASELARVAGLPRSTVARTLRTLADDGFVEEAKDGAGWMLGYELVRLARAADPFRRVVEAAQPALLGLRDAAAESALLAVPRGRPGMEIVLQIDAGRQVGVANWVGTDVPLHASAAGKVILAELDADELEEWLGSQQLVAFTESTITDAGVHAPSSCASADTAGPSSWTSSSTVLARWPFQYAATTAPSPARSGSAGRRSGLAE